MRLRTAQRADIAVIEAFGARADFRFERSATDTKDGLQVEVLERDGSIVGISKSRMSAIASPSFHPEPVPPVPEFIVVGAQPALIGEGFFLDPTLDASERARAHRLCRTLRADQDGLRYTICRAPLPEAAAFDPAGTVQQIAAGAIDWAPVTTLLKDGYWPAAVAEDRSVWLVREATWL